MALPKPPKDFYSLTEVAEAWEWSISDILEYAKHRKLLLCVCFIRERASLCEVIYDMDKNRVEKITIRGDMLLDSIYPVLPRQLNEHMGGQNGRHEDCQEPYIRTDFLYQDLGFINKDFFNNFQFFDPHAPPHCTTGSIFWTTSEILISKYGRGLEARYGYDLNRSIDLPLKITHEEKTRFEGELGGLSVGLTARDNIDIQNILNNDIGNKERGTWLKIIYLLAMKIAEKNKTALLVKGTPNAVAFESLMKTTARELELVKRLNDEDKPDQIKNITYGMSDSTLSKIFNEGEKLINKYFE